jgi:c-di-GMP-binding flagellar brake protein YcgR
MASFLKLGNWTGVNFMSLATPYKNGIRKYVRINADISARVYCKGAPPSLARAHDISCGGLCLYAPLELNEGDIIKVAFELPHSRMQFGVSAVVKSCNGFRYGLEFTNLTPEEVAEIQRVTRILQLAH